MLDSVVLYVQSNQSSIILYTVAGSVILSLILAFMGKVIFYNDFKDLGLSAALCFIPLLILFGGMSLSFRIGIPISWLQTIASITFALLFLASLVNTWRANKSIWKTVIVLVSKTALSFIYAIYLLNLIFPDKGGKRSVISMIVVGILTPLLFALVADKSALKSLIPTENQ